MTVLRDYQERAIESVYRYLRMHEDNPCVVIPTGGGKTPILARICSDVVKEWGGRVIVLAHVKELLEQSLKHIERDAPGLGVGIYSAGLGSKDTGYPVTIAGIQSAYRNVEDFPAAQIIIVDEAHRIPPDGEGMYRTFLDGMLTKDPRCRLIGLTATPYRTGTGMICGPDNLLNRICFEVSVRELIAKGYLCGLTTKGPMEETDFSGVRVERGEFVQEDLEALMMDERKIALAVMDVMQKSEGRKSILVFSAGVAHGQAVTKLLRDELGQSVGEVYGDTPSDERGRVIREFKDGRLRFLVNRDVLTLGFDAPNVDCVVLLRATMSAGLYYQMCGRGFRIHPGKETCQILDFGGNVLRHGPVDVLAPDGKAGNRGEGEVPVKKCPECATYVPAASLSCLCGFQFPPREINHGTKAGEANVLSAVEEIEVKAVRYSVHTGKESGIDSLRVEYDTGISHVSEFVCIEHSGYPAERARMWWRRRTTNGPCPATADEAVKRADSLRVPKAIMVNFRGKYPDILAYKF